MAFTSMERRRLHGVGVEEDSVFPAERTYSG